MPMMCAELSPRARVLVVEDEALLRDSTSRQLESLGYRVLAAADGPHAFELLKPERENRCSAWRRGHARQYDRRIVGESDQRARSEGQGPVDLR